MRTVYEERVAEATQIERRIVHGTARMCSPNFGKAWKGIHPFKSAEKLAAATGCGIRTAAYELSGEREPSGLSILALLGEVVPKRE